jgi:hypothetical protein
MGCWGTCLTIYPCFWGLGNLFNSLGISLTSEGAYCESNSRVLFVGLVVIFAGGLPFVGVMLLLWLLGALGHYALGEDDK